MLPLHSTSVTPPTKQLESNFYASRVAVSLLRIEKYQPTTHSTHMAIHVAENKQGTASEVDQRGMCVASWMGLVLDRFSRGTATTTNTIINREREGAARDGKRTLGIQNGDLVHKHGTKLEQSSHKNDL